MFTSRVALRRRTILRLQPTRPLYTTRVARAHHERHSPNNPTEHTADSYFKDVDETPPDPTTHQVDAASEDVQRPTEPPTGPWSRAGAKTEEYRTTSEDEPYDVLEGKDLELRYGGKKTWANEKGPETSKRGEGVDGSERFGRKPEGRG